LDPWIAWVTVMDNPPKTKTDRQGRHWRSHAWARGYTCPLWKCWNVFCAVIVTAKRSDELFIHHFHNQSSVCLLGLRHQTPTGDPSISRPQFAQPWKKSCGHPWMEGWKGNATGRAVPRCLNFWRRHWRLLRIVYWWYCFWHYL